MKKWFSSREAKKITGIILILCVTLGVQIIGFSYFNDRLYRMSLEHAMEQVEELSIFAEKNIQLEINRYIHILKVVETQLDQKALIHSQSIIEHLQQAHRASRFKMMGLSDLNGNGICSTGEKYDIFYEGIREHIKNGEVFISNVLKDKTEMLIFIAIPFKSENQIRGILWGKYALMDMVGNLDFSDTSYKYFQIIDDQGNYLLPSSKQLIQGDAARGAPETIWDSLNTYHYTDSMSPNQLYESIQNRESGSFYLESEGKGRYINYRPLDINNWYLFSIQEEDGLHAYVHHTREIAVYLFTLLSIGLLTIFGIIYNLIYSMYKKLVKQNSEVQAINAMFRTTLQQTRSIPFAIDKRLKELIFYGYPTKDLIHRSTFSDMNPNRMLKKGILDPNSLGEYAKLYQSVIVQHKKCDPVILYCRFGNTKTWIRARIMEADNQTGQMIGVLEDYGEQREKELQIETHLHDIKKIEKKSQIDFLTKLYNREAFIEKLETALEQDWESQQTSALLILDLDHFKEVNDCMGHGMGDIVLQKTADTLQSFFRMNDLVGRLGGDEFVVFARNIRNIPAFEQRIKELNRLLCKVYYKGNQQVEVSASIGIVLTGKNRSSFQTLYEKADKALYRVKQANRNGYQIDSEPI